MAHVKQPMIDVKVHRRILRFLNAARRPEDLMAPPRKEIPLIRERFMHGNEGAAHADEHRENLKGKHLLDRELAKGVFEEREKISPIYGFQHIRQLLEIKGFDARVLGHMTTAFSAAVHGEWETIYDGLTPDRTPTLVYHAALLHTGWVLFLPNAYGTDTVLWNPEDGVPATAFKALSAATTGLGNSLVCSGHSFLSDGKLLAAGGNAPTSNKAWKFDPLAETWVQTAGDMVSARWYPTLVTLGDDTGRVLVVDGSLSNGGAAVTAVEVYSESSDSFDRVFGPLGGPADTSADRGFNWLYPGLHLLPNGQVFHTKVGDRHVGSDETALFSFSGLEQGGWTDLTGAASGDDRWEGMSALLLRKVPTDPDRILVVGGGNATTQATIGIIESPPTAGSTWLTGTFPDSLPRNGVNVVVLPDSTVFICGGRPSSPAPVNGGACWIYNPSGGVGAGAFSEMDELEYSRQHHSAALLLPSAKVMVTGGDADTSRKIEVFSPPYLFNPDGSLATRPGITSFPDPDAGQIVLHGSVFEVGTANPGDITNVVLVRPMAVTHQTDTEQKVIQLSFTPGATTLSVTAPDGRVYPYGAGGGHTHAIAGRGYYMLFILNSAGVPSKAKFIRLV
jgi:hypothetical protein